MSEESSLEKVIRRRIFGRLEAMREGIRKDISIMCERLGILESILLLYYYDNREDLKDKK